jgi:hypothetical protein|tara:strand:+ start:2314 stop:2544 length:231 start_codon:yes stop_codon:yes gene_type:complete
MEVLNKVKEWAGGLANVGISIAALMIVVEVLGLGAIPFFPEVSVVANVSAMLGTLGAEGLMGLVALWVLYAIWDKR